MKSRLEEIGVIRQAFRPVFEEMETKAATRDAEFQAALKRVSEVLNKVDSNATVTIPGLAELIQQIGALAKRDNTVNVELSDHTVDVPDLAAVTEVLRQVSQMMAINRNINDYRPHDQAEDASAAYYGFEHSDGSWYVMRQIGSVQRYAAGHGDYENNWKAHAKLTYGLLSEAMA